MSAIVICISFLVDPLQLFCLIIVPVMFFFSTVVKHNDITSFINMLTVRLAIHTRLMLAKPADVNHQTCLGVPVLFPDGRCQGREWAVGFQYAQSLGS